MGTGTARLGNCGPSDSLTIPATSLPDRIHENAAAVSITELPQGLRDFAEAETKHWFA